MSEILFGPGEISLILNDFALILSIMHSKGVPQQESSLRLSIWKKKIRIMNAGKAGELIIFNYMYNSAVSCKDNMIVPAILSPPE